jgi:hypothetical protein
MSWQKTFTWRGIEFTWNGRRHMYESSSGWWVTHTRYHQYFFLDERDVRVDQSGEPIENEVMAMQEARCRWIAHSGEAGGDGAVRATRVEALEGALQYALRYHHGRIAELRKFMGA